MVKRWKTTPEVLTGHNIPQPLHGVAPRVVLGNQWWELTRQEAYASTDYHCKACGIHKSKAKFRKHLEGHELYKINYRRGRMRYLKTVPLCHACHYYIHDGRLRWMLETRRITHGRFIAIIKHGDNILFEAGLERVPYDERRIPLPIADWKDWRLVVNGREYPPKFKTLEEWERNNK